MTRVLVLSVGTLMLAVSAQQNIPASAQVGISKECEEKIQGLSEETEHKDVPMDRCRDLDTDILAEFGINDCPKMMNRIVTSMLGFQCIQYVQGTVVSKCKGALLDDACARGVGQAAKAWGPAPLQLVQGEETPEGTEEILALTHVCYDGAEKAGEGVNYEADCVNTKPEELKAMGLTDEDCVPQAKKMMTGAMAFLCTSATLLNVQAEKFDIKDLKKEHVTKAAVDFFTTLKNDPTAMRKIANDVDKAADKEAERLKFFLMNGWPKKVLPVSTNKTAILVGTIAMATVAIVLMACRRGRAPHLAQEEEEMLVGAE